MILKKSTSGQKWPALESKEPIIPSSSSSTAKSNPSDAIKRAVLNASSSPASNTAGPAYPTSSRKGPKDWDKLAADLTKKKKPKSKDHNHTTDLNDQTDGQDETSAGKDEEEEEEVEEDDDDDVEGSDPVNGFFKKLYANADPDTRRAMMKSYQESNGTALSTNWKEVGKGKVETSPPEGMVAMKWNA